MDTATIKSRAAALALGKEGRFDVLELTESMDMYDEVYCLAMAYLYKCNAAGAVKKKDGKDLEAKLNQQHELLKTKFYFSELYHKLFTRHIRELNGEHTKLVKQINAGDRNFIYTLLRLLDFYTEEHIFCQIYRIMKDPLTAEDLDRMLYLCKEKYACGMTTAQMQDAVDSFIKQVDKREQENEPHSGENT